MSVAEEYLSYLDMEVAGECEGAQDTAFRVDTDVKADWCCRKIEQLRAKMAERDDFYKTEAVRLQSWRDKEDEQDQKAIDFFVSMLQPYFDALRESGTLGKRKSHKLPHGTLKVRSQQPHYEKDYAKLRPWAIEVGLTKTPEPDWAAIKQRGLIWGNGLVDAESGELIPGVVVIEQPEAFAVVTGGGE